MLAKQYKLNLRQDHSFFRTAEKLKTKWATIYYQPNDVGLRFQVIVPKKCAKLATDRNSIKRFVYDMLAQFISQYADRQTSLVIVVHTSKIVESKNLEMVQLEVEKRLT